MFQILFGYLVSVFFKVWNLGISSLHEVNSLIPLCYPHQPHLRPLVWGLAVALLNHPWSCCLLRVLDLIWLYVFFIGKKNNIKPPSQICLFWPLHGPMDGLVTGQKSMFLGDTFICIGLIYLKHFLSHTVFKTSWAKKPWKTGCLKLCIFFKAGRGWESKSYFYEMLRF